MKAKLCSFFGLVLALCATGAALARSAVAVDGALPVCQLIATGGTIAMKIDPVKGAPVPALSGEDLVAGERACPVAQGGENGRHGRTVPIRRPGCTE